MMSEVVKIEPIYGGCKESKNRAEIYTKIKEEKVFDERPRLICGIKIEPAFGIAEEKGINLATVGMECKRESEETNHMVADPDYLPGCL